MGKGVAVAVAWMMSVALWGCNISQPPPFDPREIQRAERVRSADVEPGRLLPLPTTRESPFPSTQTARGGDGAMPADTTQPDDQGVAAATTLPTTSPSTGRPIRPTESVRLPIQEIIQRAAMYSAEVRVAGYDPAIAETRITEYEARYDPIFFLNPKVDRQNDRTAGSVTSIPDPTAAGGFRSIPIDVENNTTYTAEAGIKQYLSTGGQVSLSYQMQNFDYQPRRFLLNNYFDSEIKFQLNQPLLREFGYEINWARITIARNDQRISLMDFRKSLEDNTNELEKDYWQLYEAEREVQIQETLLEATRDLGRILWTQFTIGGQATEVEASQAAAQIRSREAVLVRTRAHLRDLSDDIKRRMNDPSLPVASNLTILAADDPNITPIVFDLQDQIETAMNNRLELGQQQLRVDSAAVATKVALNGLWPKLDFVSSVSLQGLATNLADAISDQLGDTHLIYSLGLQLEIPLGNREARAILRRAQLQRMQAVEEYRNIVAKVSEDVSTAVREVETTWDEMRAHRQARYHFEAQLQGLVRRRTGGVPFTPESVQLELDAQERLAQSERDEANAIAQHNVAISRLEHDKGTILRYNNILMVEEKEPWNLAKTAPNPPLRHLPPDLVPARR